jgi:WD40 repeat protein
MDTDETLPTIRIFISSPGDLGEERDRAKQVIEGLRRRYSRRFHLKPVLWEDIALQADMSFQQGIDRLLSENQGIDIAVFLLWSRLGSLVGPRVLKEDGTEYLSGTERELHLMMQARNQSGGKRPALLVYTRRDETSFEERLRGKPTTEKEDLIAQKKLVEAFIAQTFQDMDRGYNIGAYHSFDRPVMFSQRLRVHLIELLDQLAGGMTDVVWDIHRQGPPFLGLKAFQPEHADVFFGREEETLEARFVLREQAKQGCAFLLLTGASGSGKSSLARAGILPDVVQYELDDQVVAWRWLVITPAELASDPVLALVRRLAGSEVMPELGNDLTSLEKLARGLRENPRNTFDFGIQPHFDRLSAQQKGRLRLLLVIDQLEEVFAGHVMTVDDRRVLLRVIETLAKSGSVWVLATARSDFYHQIQGEPSLVRLLENRGSLPVLLPSPDALQRLIEEPARLAGLRFEELNGVSLASRILRDTAAHAELLPLLGFVLRELFESRTTDGLLTAVVYDQLGGVVGAVGQKAEEAFLSLPPESQAAFAELLPLLVTVEVTGDQSAVRRRARLEDLRSTQPGQILTDRLIADRFLTTDRQDDTPVASLAHETLLRSWPRMSAWITANRDHLRLRARVEQSQQRWLQQGRHDSLLLPAGLPLEEGRQLLANGRHLVSSDAAEYIRTSVESHKRVAARKRRMRNRVIIALSILTTLSVIAGGLAWHAQSVASNAQVLAENREQEAIRSKDELTQQVYDNSIAIAEREITQNQDIGKASLLLQGDTCPKELRGWEWYYLMRLRNGGTPPLEGHKTGLWGVEFSPDGSLIATCSIDGTLKIWDAHSRQLIRSIDADQLPINQRVLESVGIPRLPIMCLAFSPDGKLIATGSFYPQPKFNPRNLLDIKVDRDSPGLVRIWNVASGENISSFQDQKGVVLSLTFSPDGWQIASSSISPDNSFVVWDVKTNQVIKRVLGHKSQIHRLRYSPDSSVLASGDTDGIVKLWDGASFKEVLSIPAHSAAPVTGISFSPSGSCFATAGEDGVIRVWETASGKIRLELEGHAGAAFDVRYSPNGQRLASAGFDKTVRLWDAATGNPKITLRGHHELVWNIAFSPDGQKLVSASFDNTARIWDATPRDYLDRSGEFTVGGHQERVNCVALSITGRLASGSWDKTIKLWDAQTGTPAGAMTGHQGAIFGLAFSQDGRRIASASWDHTAKVWDCETCRELLTFTGHTAPVHSVAFSPDGHRVASAGFDGQIKIWDSTNGIELVSCDGFIFPVMAVAFSPDGKRVASGGADRTVKIWDAGTGKVLLALKAHKASIHSVAFSPDGTRVASASWDRTVRIWDVTTGGDARRDREVRQVLGHEDRVNSVTFSPDGKRIATASEDKAVRVWDLASGKELVAPRRHRAVVWSIAFTVDGKRLVSGCWEKDNWIHAWRIEPED